MEEKDEKWDQQKKQQQYVYRAFFKIIHVVQTDVLRVSIL